MTRFKGLAGDKGSWHVKFLLPGFHGSSPKTKQSFPQKQNSKSNQFAGSPVIRPKALPVKSPMKMPFSVEYGVARILGKE